ncbi:hypothetical protein T07_552 [Trichinella nelsoni]|uniref:Uncharacterized protein n=1 Tax=Trichinella nelsoni TaxID=6336 RepID=A0A0V0SER2_9BILA|nr:hypothetical protein T07_552 [Trichinella nelsoni]
MAEFWYRIFCRHCNEVFVEIPTSYEIFLCFGQLDFPSFSFHFEYMISSPISNSLPTEEETSTVLPLCKNKVISPKAILHANSVNLSYFSECPLHRYSVHHREGQHSTSVLNSVL